MPFQFDHLAAQQNPHDPVRDFLGIEKEKQAIQISTLAIEIVFAIHFVQIVPDKALGLSPLVQLRSGEKGQGKQVQAIGLRNLQKEV